MTPQDQYLHTQLAQILQPGEQVIHTAYMRRQPGLLMQMLLVGGLLLFLMTKAYFVVLTNRRLILIRTKMGFWSAGPQMQNLGIEEFDARGIQKVSVSGFMNNRSMTFYMADRSEQTLRISPWFKQISGTKAFFEGVPQMVASGQLAQLAGGAQAPQMGAGGYAQQGQQQQQQYGAPPQQQQQQYGPPPGFPPGARIQVAAQDGNRYPATVVQEQNGHYLCSMPDGQQHWFPAGSVSAG